MANGSKVALDITANIRTRTTPEYSECIFGHGGLGPIINSTKRLLKIRCRWADVPTSGTATYANPDCHRHFYPDDLRANPMEREP